jgi:hypothetical protein
MGQGYKARPEGMAAIAAQLADLQRQINSIRTASGLQNSSIDNGGRLTVHGTGVLQIGEATDEHMLLYVDPVLDSAALDMVSPGGDTASLSGAGGSIGLSSTTPAGTNPGTGPSSLSLLPRGSSTVGPSAEIDVGSYVALRMFGPGAGFSYSQGATAAYAELNGVQVFSDGSSTRLMTNSASLVMPSSTAEVRVRDFQDSTYIPIRASAFTVSSSGEVKQTLEPLPWSALDVVRAAAAHQWRYQVEHGDPDRLHYGPVTEDLPEELVDRTSEIPAIDLVSMIGVLWGAVQELADRLDAAQNQ